MALLFFDTSALVKRYYEEPGTEAVDALIEGDSTIVISSLSVVETVSAFRRKYNRSAISETRINDLLSAVFEEALTRFVIVPMAESVLQLAFTLVLDGDLRTLDSLQLSTALGLDTDDELLRFVTADAELAAAAEANGLSVSNPVS
jgi:Predicted nucleic acid-binding protein, contains PIN domain